jgi:ABC-2 type transport system permease protein
MNLRGGGALIKGMWLSWLQYRGFFFLLAFGWMVPPLIYLLVWSTAAADQAVGGLTRGEFVAYYLVLILVNQFTYSQTNWTVGDLIRYGKMSRLLLRPIPPIYDVLASEFAGKVVYMLFAIPVVAVLAVVLRPEMDFRPENGLAFIPALLLAWTLRFFWGYWLALLAFWATRADALLALQDSLIFLLAGQVAPIALLPGFMQAAAKILPFRYMLSFPVEILSGQLDAAVMLTGFIAQIGWAGVAVGLYMICWRAGLRRYSAVGG